MAETWEGKPVVVALMGPPASGKGTLAAGLAKELRMPTFSTGELLREAAQQNADLHWRLKAGRLATDDEVNALVVPLFVWNRQGLVLDGYPRSVMQAQRLGAEAFRRAMRLVALELVLDEEIMAQRLAKRSAEAPRPDDAALEVRLGLYLEIQPAIQGVMRAFPAPWNSVYYTLEASGSPEAVLAAALTCL